VNANSPPDKLPEPGTVSLVQAQSRGGRGAGRRVNVFIDGEFAFALDAALAIDHGLRPGLVLSETALRLLLAKDSGEARARATAMHFMQRRLRSHAEVESRLRRDGQWPQEIIARVLDDLQQAGLLDDSAFAAAWVHTRSVAGPRGGRALRHELRQKGLDATAIEAALPEADCEELNAIAALERKWHHWAVLERRQREQKALQLLQRRGFAYPVALAAMRSMAARS
jgi:regulatory protein